jgi:hypothetical protein
MKITVESGQSVCHTAKRAARVAENARDAGYGPVATTYQTCGVIAGDYTGVTNFSYLLPGSNADVVTGEYMSDSECWLRGGAGTVQLGMTGFAFGRPLFRPASSETLLLGRMESVRRRASQGRGIVSETPVGASARETFAKNYGDMRRAKRIEFDLKGVPRSQKELLELQRTTGSRAGAGSRAELEMIRTNRPDLRAKTRFINE